jgi:nucleoside-diphosphate-sugar epimerase
MVTINQLAGIIMKIANKTIYLQHIKGPLGVRGRNSDNKLIREKLGWAPSLPLKNGLEKTYKWIEEQVRKRNDK